MTSERIGKAARGHEAGQLGGPREVPQRFAGRVLVVEGASDGERLLAATVANGVVAQPARCEVVRVTEGFIYNDALATVEPAVERAARIVALLLE